MNFISDMPCTSDDDEDEEAGDVEEAEPKEPEVKQESGEPVPPPPKKARERQSSTELYIYSEGELRQFHRRDLVANAELLDGNMHDILRVP